MAFRTPPKGNFPISSTGGPRHRRLGPRRENPATRHRPRVGGRRMKTHQSDRRSRRLPGSAPHPTPLGAGQPAEAATIAEAVRLKEAALVDFGMESSAIAGWIYSKC